MVDNLTDPFHRALHARLTEEYNKRLDALASGSARGGEHTTTAENYASQVARLAGIRDVMEMCVEIERLRYGTGREEGRI